MTTDLEGPSLKKSWAYQNRISLTAVVLASTWVFVAFSPPLIPENSLADWFTDAAAWIAFVSGLLVRVWATLWISGRKRQTVVQDGPYRLCRNPLYIGTFLMGIGLGLFLKSILFSVGLFFILMLYVKSVVPAEEKYLRHRLGADYEHYCSEVPAWLPRLSRLRKDEFFNPLAHREGVRREVMRGLWWLLLPILAETTCHLRPLLEIFPRSPLN
jgi:protein-S-isoprenylcysteine O-methyltransferase Ste14